MQIKIALRGVEPIYVIDVRKGDWLRYGEQQGLQKSRVKAKKALELAVLSIQSKCGPSLDISVDWDAFDTLLESEKAKIEKRGDQNAWVIDKAAERTVNVIKSLSEICVNDVDYKEEIAKVTSLKITPKASFDDYESVFSLNGNSISVETGHVMNRSASDFEDRLLALF